MANRVRPLLVRPGARFACFGDGTCCTGIHALGPMTRPEARRLKVLQADAVVIHPDFGEPVFREVEGRCVYLGDGLCRLHAEHGAETKPHGCSRFPFGLTATPEGGRISTQHRCPCRTLGDRPALEIAGAEPWLGDAAGRLSPELRIPPRVGLDGRSRVSFAKYREHEARVMDAIASGVAVEKALGVRPFSKLTKPRWRKVAQAARLERDGTPYGEILLWFGEMLLEEIGERVPRTTRQRPWAHTFDRAEKRSKPGVKADDILRDWLLDVIWSMYWLEHGPFSIGRAELSTRYAIASRIVRTLKRAGVREDRAAAEALLIVEVAGESQTWADAVDAFPV